jgi:phage baseplate assembly protein V
MTSSVDFWQAEFARQLGNIVQVGKVVELDAAAARIKVEIGENRTAWIPWITGRAGTVRAWSAPEPGEQVVVLSPTGDAAQGVALLGVYSDTYQAPANTADKVRTEWADGAFVEYDRAAKTALVNVPAAGKIRLVVGGTVLELQNGEAKLTTPLLTVEAPSTVMTGNLRVDGSITVPTGDVTAGNITLKTHKHGGVVPGGGTSGGPVP